MSSTDTEEGTPVPDPDAPTADEPGDDEDEGDGVVPPEDADDEE